MPRALTLNGVEANKDLLPSSPRDLLSDLAEKSGRCIDLAERSGRCFDGGYAVAKKDDDDCFV